MKFEKDMLEEKFSALQWEKNQTEGNTKRFKGILAKNRKEVLKVCGTLKKKDQHIKNIWKIILTLRTKQKNAGLTASEKNKLKKEYMDWFPSEITQNKERIEDVIDSLEIISASLFKDITTSPNSDDKVNQSENKEQPNYSIPALLSPKDKVTSSDDSPTKTDLNLQDDNYMKLPIMCNKEFQSLNSSSYPCSPDTLSHEDNENTSVKQIFSSNSLQQDATFTDILVNVEESSSRALNNIADCDIDNHKGPCYSVGNFGPLLEVKESISGGNSCDGLSNHTKSELLSKYIALSNDGLDVFDTNTEEVSNSNNLSFNFNEADNNQNSMYKVVSLKKFKSNGCVSTEPLIENLVLLEDNTNALGSTIQQVSCFEEKVSIYPLESSEVVNEEKVTSNESAFVSDDLESSLKELDKFRRFFSIPKRPLSPLPPTPPKVELQIESLEMINSEYDNNFSKVESCSSNVSNKKSKTLKEIHMLQKSEDRLVENQFEVIELESKSLNLASNSIQQNNMQGTSDIAALDQNDCTISECQSESLKDMKFVGNKESAIPLMKVCQYNKPLVSKESTTNLKTFSNIQSTKKRKNTSDEQILNSASIRKRGRTKLNKDILRKPNMKTGNGEEMKEQFENCNSNQALVGEDTTMFEESMLKSSWVAAHKPQKVRTEHRKNSANVKVSNFDDAKVATYKAEGDLDKSQNSKNVEHTSPVVTFEKKHIDTVYNVETKKQINLNKFLPVQTFVRPINSEESASSDFVSTDDERKQPTCVEDIISSIRNIHPDSSTKKTLNVIKDRNSNLQCLYSEKIIKEFEEKYMINSSGKHEGNKLKSKNNINKSCDIQQIKSANPFVCKEDIILDTSDCKTMFSEHLIASKITSNVGYYPPFQKGKNPQNITFSKSNESPDDKATFIPSTSIKCEKKIAFLDINKKSSSLVHEKSSCSPAKDYAPKQEKEHIIKKRHTKINKGILKVQKTQKQNCASTSSNGRKCISECDSNIPDLNENKNLVFGTDETSSSTLHQKPRSKRRIKKLRENQKRMKKRKKIFELQKIQNKKCQLSENPIENFFRGFQNDQLCHYNLKHIVQSLVKLLINPSSSPNKASLLFHVFNYLSNTEMSPLLAYSLNEDQSAILPFEEKCIVVALFRIELKKIPHLDGLLKTAVTTLHNLILSKKFTACGLASLCRVFTEVCKREGNSMKPVMLCAELLKTKHPFSSYLVASIAGVWKELFQIEKNISVEEKLLHSSILYAAKKKPKKLSLIKWNSSLNIISKNFNAPPVNDAKSAIHILKNFIQSKCQSDSWNSQYMTSALTILAVYEDWDWVKENLLDNYIIPNLSIFGKTTLNEVAFDLYCNLYVDIYFVKPGVYSLDKELSNIYNCPEIWQGKFVNDCVALALIRLNFLKKRPLPSFLSSWFESNHQKPKVQENTAVFNRRLMLVSPTVLQLEEIL